MSEQSIIEQWIAHGNRLAAAGRWDEALDAYQKVSEHDQHNLEVRNHIISICIKKGDYQEVILQHIDCAEILTMQGQRQQAIERYEAILRLEETVQLNAQIKGDAVSQVRQLVAQYKPEIYFQIGEFHLESKKIDLALQYLRKSHELSPGRWQTHLALGKAYMQKEMDKEAIGEFQEVLRLAPEESAQAYERLGEVFVRQGRPAHTTIVWFQHAADYYLKKNQAADAIRALEKILEVEPGHKETLDRLGEMYARNNNKEMAVRSYTTLADIYEKEGSALDKVIHLLESVVQLDPQNRAAIDKLINIYTEILKRSATNATVRQRLIDHLYRTGRQAELPPHYLAVAEYHAERGMLDEAVKALRRLLEIDAQHVEAREKLGDIFLKRDQQNEALEEFQNVIKIYRARGDEQAALDFQQRLIQIFPQAAELQYQVAVALRDRGDHEGALRELDRIISQRPDDMVALAYRAESLLALQHYPAAIQAYARVLQLDPTQTDVRKTMIGAMLNVGQFEEASGQIRTLSPEDPKRAQLQRRLVAMLVEQRQLERAEAEIDQMPADDEQKLGFRKELVKLHLDAGNLDKAFEGLPEIPRSDRERNGLVTRLLEIPLGRGDLATAAKTIHRLPEDDPLKLTFHRRLITTYLEAGRMDEAAEEVARLPEADEGRARLTSQVIGGFLAANQLDKAAREINGLADADPMRNSYMGQLIEAYLSSNDLERAAQEVARLGAGDEIRPRYHRRIIQAYLNANRFEEAERDILALDDADPEKRSFLRLLIQKYLTLGQLDKVRVVVGHLPDDMEEKNQYMSGLVHNYLDSGDLAMARQQVFAMAEGASSQGNHLEAERLYREILAYQPADMDIRLRLSQEIAYQGQHERAREGMLVLAGRFHRESNATSCADIYSRMLDMDSGNLNARYRLGTLWAEQGQTAQALEQFAHLAKVYLEQNLPEVAQRVLRKILDLDPKDIEHRRQAIRLLIRNLRFEEATEHYRVLMGIHLERGEVDEALECVKEIVNLQPLNLELRQQLGAMFLRAGFLEQGVALLEALANDCREKRDNERLFKVLWTLVDSLQANEQWETALEYRERIADIYKDSDQWPKAQEEFLQILDGYLSHGHKEPAEGIFVKLIDGFFRNKCVNEGIESLETLGESLTERGRPAMAMAIRERVANILERLDQWDRALELLVGISHRYFELEEVDLGLHFLRRAADQALAHDRIELGIEYLYMLASQLVEHRGLQAARPILDELLRTAQDNVPYLERVGDVLFQQGLFEEARPIYHEVLEKEPGRAQSLSRVAIIYAREGRLEDAADIAKQIFSKGLVSQIINEYKQITGFQNQDAGSHIRLGKFYQQMGFLEEAIMEFRKAAEEPNRLLQAYNHLALAFRAQGYPQLAVRQFQKVLEMPGYQDEELLEIRFNLACALEDEGLLKEAMGAFQECFVVDIRYRDVAQRMEALSQKMQGVEA